MSNNSRKRRSLLLLRLDPLLNRLGYYHLEENRFYYTDEDGTPHRELRRVGGRMTSGYSGAKQLHEALGDNVNAWDDWD